MRIMFFKFFIMVFAVVSPTLASSRTYVDAKTLADRDEASVPKARVQALLDSQGKAISQVLHECLPTTQEVRLSPFVVVAELDSVGRVVATWRKGDSELAICFENKVASHLVFNPPHAPFFTSFEIDLHSAP